MILDVCYVFPLEKGSCKKFDLGCEAWSTGVSLWGMSMRMDFWNGRELLDYRRHTSQTAGPQVPPLKIQPRVFAFISCLAKLPVTCYDTMTYQNWRISENTHARSWLDDSLVHLDHHVGLSFRTLANMEILGSVEDLWLTDHEDYDVFLFERVWEFREEAWFCRVVAQWIFELCFMSFWKLTCCMSPSFNTYRWQWHMIHTVAICKIQVISSDPRVWRVTGYQYTGIPFVFWFWKTNGFCLDPDPSSGLWR